ncbi:ABC transporter permease subunit [Sneathiella sp. P13V-1]|uniref:ABC transporter permease n=1 Tax=Sneathiella sp. P13V-1 TaxID=2697366 RepID=UPI00187B5287|nr:ABC transporter permease [Sneathiella sp. P13V-1]MBE7637087.1 ABC transporter permease subunit [Sneathiella sp. P13V-1]
MFNMFAKRCVLMLGMLLGLMVITFLISHVTPGDPAALAAGPDATEEMIERIRVERGFDKPMIQQFAIYVGGVVTGDLGTSIHTTRDVLDDILTFFPATFELVVFSIFVAILLGIPLGVIAAVKQNSWLDNLIRIISSSGVGLPMFWLGLMLQLYFGLQLGWFPLGGRLELMTDPPTTITGLYTIDALLTLNFPVFFEALQHILLPAVTLCFPALASIIRVNRAEMLETLALDYITNARAQGIGVFRIVALYALKNSILPTLALIGLRFGWMLGGTVLVESVFDWPGIGLYTVQAATASDFEPVMASTLVLGAWFMLANFIIDILYGWMDPRVLKKA